jgi:hypothetical protein
MELSNRRELVGTVRGGDIDLVIVGVSALVILLEACSMNIGSIYN